MNSWLGRDFRAAAVAVALLAPACGGGEAGDASTAPSARGDRLVVGATVEEWGLLVLPRRGGRAELRALDDPSRTLWGGRTPLPASLEARVLDGGAVVLRTEEGTVARYDPAVDAVTEVGRVGEGAVWRQGAGDVGAWVERDRLSALFVSAGDAWRAPIPEGVVWAAPVGRTGLAAIVGEPEAGRPVVLPAREEADPAAGAGRGADPSAGVEGGSGTAGPEGEPPRVRPPALVTGFGRRMAAVGGDGRRLVLLSLPELGTVREIELDAPVRAVASSPSSHEIYAALGSSPTRVVAYDRLTGRRRTLARIEGRISWIRPATLGGALLVGGEETAWRIPLEGGEAARLPGRPGADMPLELPAGGTLVRTEAGLAVWTPGGGEGGRTSPVTGPADAWWLPVRWRPPAPERVATGGDAAEDAAGEAEALAAGVDAAAAEGDVAAAGESPVTPPGEPGTGAPDAPGASTEPMPGAAPLEPGFYAIVSSSQRGEAIAALVARLAEAGFAAGVQRHRDEAGELWFRAMVGPYETRERADAAARQLRRERGLQAWIAEVGPDVRPAGLRR